MNSRSTALLLGAILVVLLVIAALLVVNNQQAYNAANPSPTINMQAAVDGVQTWTAGQTATAAVGG